MTKPLKISGYYLNNRQKNFDYTMDRFYELLEDQKKPQQKNEFTAVILSGLVTTSTTSPRFFDILETSLNGVISYEYKIRFIEQDEKYNRVIDPFSNIVSTEDERTSLINDHESAYFEENSSMSSPPNPGSTVIITKIDGIYKITKILTFSDGNMPPINSSISSQPSSAFSNAGSAFGFLKDFVKSATTSLDELEVRFTGKRRYSKTKSVNMEGKTYRPYIRRYVGQAQKYKNTDIENGVKISDLHVKVIGYTEYHSPIFLPDLVDGFKQLCEAYEAKFRKKIRLTDSFRSWKSQISTRKKYGQPSMLSKHGQNLAAKPGSSNHGWGLAFDWDTEDSKGDSGFDSETYKWMLENAPKYGFHNPLWAQKPDGWPKVKRGPKGGKGSKPEPWHFEWKFPGRIFN